MKKQLPKNVKLNRFIYLLLAVFLLSWILIWGGNSFRKVWKIDNQLKDQNIALAQETLTKDSLSRANNRLKSDPHAAEEVAREEHGMIKENETIWRFKPYQDNTKETKETKK